MSTLNGFGTRNIGVYNYRSLEDEESKKEEFDTTLWFCMFWLPMIPLKSYRIRKRYDFGEGMSFNDVTAEGGITFSKDEFAIIKQYDCIKWLQVIKTYLFIYGIIILYLTGFVMLLTYLSR